MYSVPHPSWLRRHPVVVFMIHTLLIVSFFGSVDTWYGQRAWLLDDLFFMGLLFFLQWLLLKKQPVFSVWVVVGSIVAYSLTLFNATVLQSILIEPLADRFFPIMPNSFTAKEYYLMQYLIFNTVQGLGIGIFQAVFLKLDSLSYRWWVPMTTVAYTATSFWSYYHFIVPL